MQKYELEKYYTEKIYKKNCVINNNDDLSKTVTYRAVATEKIQK
jgi:hypothetical protein